MSKESFMKEMAFLFVEAWYPNTIWIVIMRGNSLFRYACEKLSLNSLVS